MSNQPTESKPVEILKKFKGLNDQADSLKRPSGTITSGQNVYDSQAEDANRREGRIMQSLSDGNPIGVIYNLTWDDGANTQINLSGSDFQYNAPTYPGDSGIVSDLLTDPCADGSTSPVDPTTGEPLCPPPFAGTTRWIPPRQRLKGVPDFVPIIRALSEAYFFSQRSSSAITVPSQRVVVDFYTRTTPITMVASGIRKKADFMEWFNRGYAPRVSGRIAVAPVPPYTSIDLDHYYVDYVMDGAPRWVVDLNVLIGQYNNVVLHTYLKTDPTASPQTLSNYSAADNYTFSATPYNWQTVCSQFAAAINSKLSKVKVQATEASLQTKSGTASDSAGCYNSTISISGYTSGMFDVPAGCLADPGIGSEWDGTMTFSDISFERCGYNFFPNPTPPFFNLNGADFEGAFISAHSGGDSPSTMLVQVNILGGTDVAVVWSGTKASAGTFGDPRGVWTRTGGCGTGPATLTVV